jgi:cell division protein FtsB
MTAVLRSRPLKFVASLFFLAFVVVLLALLGVLPIRAYAEQRNEMSASTQRLAMLTAKNAELRDRIKLLKTDSEIKRIARDQYAMVPLGEPLRVIPGLTDLAKPGSTLPRAILADRVPIAAAESSDSSLWATLKDFVSFAF